MKKLFLFGLFAFIVACSLPSGGQSATLTVVPQSTPTEPLQTPLALATITPTSTPIATFSPTPLPLYFTDEFDLGLGAWTSFTTSGENYPQVSVENGYLKLNFSSPHTWYYAINKDNNYTNVRVDAKFDSSGNGPTSMGVICRYNEANGWYEYNISNDGTYNILLGQWLAQGIAQYTPIVNDTTEYLRPGRTAYEIGLACTDNTLWLYINGKLFRKLDVTRFGLKKGKIGIAAAVFENVPVTTYFDWVKISAP